MLFLSYSKIVHKCTNNEDRSCPFELSSKVRSFTTRRSCRAPKTCTGCDCPALPWRERRQANHCRGLDGQPLRPCLALHHPRQFYAMKSFERNTAAVWLELPGCAGIWCSTIDADSGAGDIGRCRRQQIGDSGRYLCFRSKTLQRHPFGEFVELLLHFQRVSIETARHDAAWSDRIHAHT